MSAFIYRRLVQTIPLLALVSILVFLLLDNMPGDPLYMMLRDTPGTTAEDYLRLRQIYGLDDPSYVRYFKWTWQVLTLNPGFSREYAMPAMDVIVPHLHNTLLLSVTALVIGKLVAIVLGIYSALRQYSIGDYLTMSLAFIGYSLPGFWLGLVFIVIFSVRLGWLPTSGIADANVEPGFTNWLVDRLRHLVMPLSVLALTETASTARYMRSGMLEVVHQEYMNTARSKGLPEQLVVRRHALKNALIPVVTVVALSVPRVLGGAVVVETVFGYPGIGKLLYDSISVNDFTIAMVIIMVLSFVVVFSNLVADVLYALLDPRIRYERA
jgi:peptide/nickel transport system permease protein